MSFEGGAFNFVEKVEKAGSFFGGDDGTDKGRFAETSAYLGQTDRRLAGQVEAQRSAEHGHPGVEGGREGQGREIAGRDAETRAQLAMNAATDEREAARFKEDYESDLMFMDPIETPTARAERTTETAAA